jgi:hypothetical protein
MRVRFPPPALYARSDDHDRITATLNVQVQETQPHEVSFADLSALGNPVRAH